MKTERQPASDRVPSVNECRALMEEHGMLSNIAAHSEAVMRVAAAIVDDLIDPDDVERPLVVAAALMHDITKTRALETKERHDESGGALARSLGMERIAEIIEQHVFLKDFDPEGPLLAKEIVYYADKRVRHNVVVNLDQRLEYILEHYGKNNPTRHALIRENFKKCIALEQYLFRWLPFGPQDLGRF